jgi:uroporphyrinogen decarboxylase
VERMTSLERVAAVINHQIADRVPVDLHNFLTTVHYAGYSMADALQNGDMLADAQLKFWRDFGHDMLLVENGVVAEAGACGCEVAYSVAQPPRVVGHILADGLDKIDDLEVPDPYTAHPMCEVLRAVGILVHEIGDKVFIMGRADQGPVALAAALRGYEQILYDLSLNEQPELLHKVLDYCVKVQTRYALALKEQGAHGTATGGAGVDFIGPRLYRQFEHFYERQVIQAVNSPDFPVALHICGDSTLILQDMVDTGAPVLELDYKTDMRKAKEVLRGKSTFLGPINPALIWGAKSPEEVEDAAREAIAVLGPGGEFILGPGCALGADTPADNIHALIEAAKKYGHYHADGSLKYPDA